MDFELSKEQEMVRKEVRRFAHKEILPVALELDESESFSADLTRKMGDIGLFGTIVSLEESPVKENLIFAGTDDGLIQVTENGGESWRKIGVPGVPARSYVSDIEASLHCNRIEVLGPDGEITSFTQEGESRWIDPGDGREELLSVAVAAELCSDLIDGGVPSMSILSSLPHTVTMSSPSRSSAMRCSTRTTTRWCW